MREHEVEATWTTAAGDRTEVVSFGWENGGWTIDGRIAVTGGGGDRGGRDDVHYVVRTDAEWRVRQFLLFRDEDDPDLWLATDGEGRWGEVNGAWREDLTGCRDVELVVTPMGHTVAVRRSALAVGELEDALVASVDPETLQVSVVARRTTRVDEQRWRFESSVAGDETGTVVHVVVDEHGLLLEDEHGRFRRER